MSKDPQTVVKVGRSGSQSCPVVGVLVSILQRMAWVVLEGEGEFGEWDVARGGQRAAVVAVVVAGSAKLFPARKHDDCSLLDYRVLLQQLNSLSNLDVRLKDHQDAQRSTA